MKRYRQTTGLALALVLIVLAAAVVLGGAYLARASIAMAAIDGQSDMAQAKYLAESGLEHAICMLREYVLLDRYDPTGQPGWPADFTEGFAYTVADGAGTYSFTLVSDGLVLYTISCTATVGRSTQTCSLKAQVQSGGKYFDVEQALSTGPSDLTVPAGMTVTGPVHVNGDLTNLGVINGATTATGSITDLGTISPAPTPNAPEADTIDIRPRDYLRYWYGEETGEALEIVLDQIDKNLPIAQGVAFTEENPAGVVIVRPATMPYVTLKRDIDFSGTLIVDGDCRIHGDDLTMQSVVGYPTLVVTGSLYLASGTSGPIRGVVYVGNGIVREGGTVDVSVNITGALVVRQGDIDPALEGVHSVTYDAGLTTLVHPRGTGAGGAVVIMR